MKYRLDPAARDEYREAAERYLEESPRIAAAFVEQTEAAIRLIRNNPVTWRVLEGDVRRCLVRRFPFGIYTIRLRRVRSLFGPSCTCIASPVIG